MQAVDSLVVTPHTPYILEAKKKSNLRKIFEWLELPDSNIKLYTFNAPDRTEVEDYISNQYHSVYKADIQEFLPNLMTFECKNSVSAAVGFKCASKSPLFVEQYLEHPVEEAIARLGQIDQPVSRSSIIEIGNLAATWKGSSQLILTILPIILERAGYKWAIFTATAQVDKLLKKIQINMTPLCKADVNCVDNSNDLWGNYYKNGSPKVVFGSLVGIEERLGQKRIIKNLLIHYSDSIDMIVAKLSK